MNGDEWNICPENWKRNFKCEFGEGWWHLETPKVWGKTLLFVKPRTNNCFPTFADKRNMISGLIEVDYINDNHIFEARHKRPQQALSTRRKFREMLDKIEERVKNNQKTLYEGWL